ncbi:MAG: ribonuclease P protein component [Phycisphaerae bacterium]|nr:ribonuclease P protein component [Phycisphaerae bacterium]
MTPAVPRPNRFTRSFRLTHRREFQAVFAAKTRTERGPLVVHAVPNELGGLRLGLSIGRRVGNAVRRNRLKRMIREAFRTSRESMPGPYDVVVSSHAHPDLPLNAYQELLVGAMEHLHRTWVKRHDRRNRDPAANDDRRSPPEVSS